jgi:hypothetical protein
MPVLNFGCRTLVVFKGAGFLTHYSLFRAADSDPSLSSCASGWGRQTRTLHKNRERCGTQLSEWTVCKEAIVHTKDSHCYEWSGSWQTDPPPEAESVAAPPRNVYHTFAASFVDAVDEPPLGSECDFISEVSRES